MCRFENATSVYKIKTNIFLSMTVISPANPFARYPLTYAARLKPTPDYTTAMPFEVGYSIEREMMKKTLRKPLFL